MPITNSELDLFSVRPTQVMIRHSFRDEIHPQNRITNEGPFEFKISPNIYMLDLSKNYIRIYLHIMKSDGSVCTEYKTGPNNTSSGDKVFPTNLIGKTFFHYVKIFLNGKLLSDSGDCYTYQTIIETELTCKEILSASGLIFSRSQ